MTQVDNKTVGKALVTGASSGIGAAYADLLASRGFDLVLVARRIDRLDAAATRLGQAWGVSVETLEADLADRKALSMVEDRLSSRDDITMLVNNAGVGDIAIFAEAERDAHERMIDINVVALTRLCHAALPGMITRGSGTIINVASGFAFDFMSGVAVYAGSKAYVAQFTQVLHEEAGHQGIGFQALIPGLTRTELGGAAESGLFDRFPPDYVMSPADLVAASLAGLDLGELVCVPRLPDPEDWKRASAAIRAVGKSPPTNRPAPRYGIERAQ